MAKLEKIKYILLMLVYASPEAVNTFIQIVEKGRFI